MQPCGVLWEKVLMIRASMPDLNFEMVWRGHELQIPDKLSDMLQLVAVQLEEDTCIQVQTEHHSHWAMQLMSWEASSTASDPGMPARPVQAHATVSLLLLRAFCKMTLSASQGEQLPMNHHLDCMPQALRRKLHLSRSISAILKERSANTTASPGTPDSV